MSATVWHAPQGGRRRGLSIYDTGIDPDAIGGPPINALSDAASVLLRAELAGHARQSARWRRVHAFAHRMFPHAGIAFADAHVVMADAVNGDADGLASRLGEIEAMRREGRYASGPLVPALAVAFAAFERREWRAVITALDPVLAEHERIGGSRAQRDVVEFTLLKAYVNAGRRDDVSRYLANRRAGPRGIPVAGVPGAQH
jgi:hypothetical protein